ncbi:MAG: iron ABC transporter permease [Deltaproteobacteria bacterium]|jgi:iron(III) transport system permease protein|nr:iron ABC transporter permease [Deltaproteobacteria bacterium]MBT4528100.1 iron ABC transporter permease [Deltaproteobacteria bacterium]
MTTLSFSNYFKNQKITLKRLLNEPLQLILVLSIIFCLGLFVLYPLYSTIKVSLMPNGHFDLIVYKTILNQQRFKIAISNSILLGIVVATLGTIIAFLFAYTLTRIQFPGKHFFKGMVILPIISPPFIFALSAVLLLGRNGLLTQQLLGIENFNIYGFKGLVIVQTLSMFPIGFLILSGILQAIDPDLETCAMNLGAKRWKTFTTVTFPLALPGLWASWLLIFVQSLTDFGNPLILGGDFPVLSVQTYLEFVGMGNLPRGAGLAVLLLVPTVSLFILQRYILRKKSFITVTGKSTRRSIVSVSQLIHVLLIFFSILISAIISIFYISIFAGSFIKLWGINWTLTFSHYIYAFDVGLQTIKDTVLLATIATPITVIFGMVIAFLVVRKSFPGKNLMAIAAVLMFSIPGTAVGFGYMISFNQEPLLLTGTMYILLACYVFRYVPIGIESGMAALSQVSKDIGESSTNLGASSAITFRSITLPLITPSFISAATFTFVKCMTGLSAVIFLVSASWKHMTTLILAQTENMLLGQAYAMSVVLTLIILISFAVFKNFMTLGQTSVFGGISHD